MPGADFHEEERALALKQIAGEGTFDQYRLYMISAIQRIESGFAELRREVSDIRTGMKLLELAIAQVDHIERRVDALEKAEDRRAGFWQGGKTVLNFLWALGGGIVGAGAAAFFGWLMRAAK